MIQISGVLAAAVYIACREMGAHRTLDDIATACNVKRKEVSRDFRRLHSRLDLRHHIGIPGCGTYTGEQGKWMLRFNVGYYNPIVLI